MCQTHRSARFQQECEQRVHVFRAQGSCRETGKQHAGEARRQPSPGLLRSFQEVASASLATNFHDAATAATKNLVIFSVFTVGGKAVPDPPRCQRVTKRKFVVLLTKFAV